MHGTGLKSTFGVTSGHWPSMSSCPSARRSLASFSLAYEAFREATIADLAPVTKYEYVQALQLADLNWAILQAKASADVELSTGRRRHRPAQLNAKLEGDGEREYRRQLRAFEEAGGDEDDFEDPVDWDAIEEKIEEHVVGLKSETRLSGRPRRPRQSRWASTRAWFSAGNSSNNFSVSAPLGEAARPGEARAPAVGGVPRDPKGTAHRRRPGRERLRTLARCATGPITAAGKAVSSRERPQARAECTAG